MKEDFKEVKRIMDQIVSSLDPKVRSIRPSPPHWAQRKQRGQLKKLDGVGPLITDPQPILA